MSLGLDSRRRVARRIAVLAIALAGIGAGSASLAEGALGDSALGDAGLGDCAPLPSESLSAAMGLTLTAEQGVAPSTAALPSGVQPGEIVTLPPIESGSLPALPSEVILVLPKSHDGGVDSDYELAPGAKVVESFFSPITCAVVARVAGPAGTPATELVARAPESATVVVNHVYTSAATEVSAADPYRELQYGLDRAGIEASRRLTTGEGAVVAILDSAPSALHRDLSTVETLALGEDAAPPPGIHGTLMAGVIGADERNGFGISGVAPGARVLSIPVCRPAGAGALDRCLLFDLLRGIDLAYERSAQVLNLSIVGPPSPLLERAMARLDSLGVVAVAAAGNEGTEDPRYPAAYPTVVGVASTGRDGKLAPRSNRGISAEIAAPGVEILSTVPGDGFAFGDGTSLAAAHVSGVIALVTAVTGDPVAARRALFRAGHSEGVSLGPAIAGFPPVCDVFARLGRPCDAPTGPPAPAP